MEQNPCFCRFCGAISRFPQNIPVYGLIKQFLYLIPVRCLPQNPHEFCDRGLQSHIIRFQKPEFIFNGPAHFIDGHIAAFVGDLGRHDNGFSLGNPFLYYRIIAAGIVIRQAADAEGLDNNSVIVFCHVIQNGGIHGRNQLQKADIGIQVVIKYNRFPDQFLVV